MKCVVVRVPWEHGLHLRPAASLALLAKQFRSEIVLRLGQHTANLRSMLGVISLCAMMGAVLEVEVIGEDEDHAVAAIERAFLTGGGNPEGDGTDVA